MMIPRPDLNFNHRVCGDRRPLAFKVGHHQWIPEKQNLGRRAVLRFDCSPNGKQILVLDQARHGPEIYILTGNSN